MQAEILILLIAFFQGPTNILGDMYIFENPKFPKREFCEQYIKENQNELNIYLSTQYNTMPRIYENKFYCMSIDEFEKQFGHKSKKDITI